MKHIYALTYEYSYANNMKGQHSPDEAGGILNLFEDEDDALAKLEEEKEYGIWGDFSDEEALEKNCEWSDAGYTLSVRKQEVIESSKRKVSWTHIHRKDSIAREVHEDNGDYIIVLEVPGELIPRSQHRWSLATTGSGATHGAVFTVEGARRMAMETLAACDRAQKTTVPQLKRRT